MRSTAAIPASARAIIFYPCLQTPLQSIIRGVDRQEIVWSRGTEAGSDREADAVQRLIAEIDSIDARRNRVGKRILVLFFATFAGAFGLLVWSVTHAQDIVRPPGPRVPAVMHSEHAPAR